MSSAASSASHFSPIAATDLARSWDTLYAFLLIASVISCILVIGGLIWFAAKYRRQSANDKTPYISHNTTLEFLWSFIPFVIFMIVFVWGWVVFYNFRKMPENALEVTVNAQKWLWTFSYKNGRNSPKELVVPVGENVKLVMTSKDVLHSFYVPAFRNKQDVVPGRYTTLWFKANMIGNFHLFCAEYCGDNHSGMLGTVKVVSRAEFDDWLANDPFKGVPPVEIGQKAYTTRGCVACHSLGDKKETDQGPSWKGMFGRKEKLTDGTEVTVDENYIRESIMDPAKQVVAGYNPIMPTFAGQLKEEEISGLIEFIKTLK